ncbi:MAG: TlpA family protein disulfide reductase [Gemmataceae bacterium]|nr:TlpA family protein disulfide reductase [Gemmataceae bacterium]MCI0742954.1 TlpA family protein disulfide reductase [Gemmataceae bacterium]
MQMLLSGVAWLTMTPFAVSIVQEQLTSPKQQYESIEKEYDQLLDHFYALLENAKTPQEKEKAHLEHFPNPAPFLKKMLQIASAHPKEDVGYKALRWSVAQCQGTSQAPYLAEVMQLFKKHRLNDPEAGPMLQSFSHLIPNEDINQFLRYVLSKSAEIDMQLWAGYSLARMLLRAADLAEDIARNPKEAGVTEKILGKGILRWVSLQKSNALRREAEAFFERVSKDSGDSRTSDGAFLRLLVKGDLFELRFLAEGKVAPEIDGVDLEGRRMKLSDYRGKVVLIDFWGDWSSPCRGMYATKRKLLEKFKDQPFVILGVNGDERDKVKKVLETQKLVSPTWSDQPTRNGPIAKSWNVNGWPTVYLLDDKGVIRSRIRISERIEDFVDEIMAEFKDKKR